ncbi:unnamed protein product [Mucor hiemalis]
MKADYCVDYLSHQWNTDDLITTFKETRRQRQKYVVNNITSTTSLLTKNEKKFKKSEEYKSNRFQNALWRNMAKNCTKNLGRSNELINPATVSWQKESDITWLYGPLYTNSNQNIEKSRINATQSSLQGLKPVLKNRVTCSDSSLIFYSIDSTTTTTKATYEYNSATWSEFGGSSATTSGLCSSRSSFSSVSSSKSTNSIGVHFNPEIIEIEYQPEYPVSLESSPLSCVPHSSEPYTDCGYDEDEDDVLWSLLVDVGESLKSSTYTRISTLFSNCLFFYNTHQELKKHSSQQIHKYPSTTTSNNDPAQLFLLMVSMMKSVVSLTTTWVLYQSLSPLSSLLSVATSASKPVKNTAGQSSTKQSKKTRLIIL